MSTINKMLALTSGLTAVWAASDAFAAEYQCIKTDSSLRIAVEVKKLGHTLPCEVIAEDDRGERAVLYSAQYDRDYCPSRIEQTKSELEQDGWSCQQTSVDNVVKKQTTSDEHVAEPQAVSIAEDDSSGSGGALVTDNGRTITASRQCSLGDDTRQLRIETDNPRSGTPCELIYWADGDQTKPGELLWRAEHDATFCPRRLDVIVEKWTGEGWNCTSDEFQTAAVDSSPAPENTANRLNQQVEEALTPSADRRDGGDTLDADQALAAVVAADAKRIGEWMDVDPDIEIAARGDLNDDGSDDAVVFLAYQSDQAAYRQYLMSYLVAGDGYELASVKLLTGASPPPAQARVDEIDKGVIWLTMPDDDSSTPSQTGYELRNQQLVEVDSKRPPSIAD